MIYLDYNATTPLLPNARLAMVEAFDCLGNPSSIHGHGRAARKILENARTQVSEYFDLPSRNITFTSGATEANNMILKGFERNVFISAVEHDSILSIRKDAAIIPVDCNGVIELEALARHLKNSLSPSLVCILAVNNETGVIQPINEILKICNTYNAHLHVDAAQAVGKISLAWNSLPSFTISAHKFGGPKGAGALIVNGPLHLKILIEGGGQERSLRAGTENLIGIAGMGSALTTPQFDWQKLEPLQKKLEENLLKICPEATIFGKKVARVSNTTSIAMPRVQSEVQLMHFDLNNISVSSGAACSSGKVKASHVLKAMGVSDELSRCTLRISYGWKTTEDNIDHCIAAWADLHQAQTKKQKEVRYA
jgi:cysteine desulfurase